MAESIVMAFKAESCCCYAAGYKFANKPICTHCEKSGYTIDKCYLLHGFPPSFKFIKGRNVYAHNVSID